ncbi:MAG TPA: hypothetical protein VFE69_06265, partial [Ilumatobacteraceae bacterium]|nr:hypothetical protein [Ilumatobacteraceae bacterium]
MHPIERLRYVARSSGGDQRMLVRETAGALRGLGFDPAGLVVACRRIVERHPNSGPLWWLCASVLAAPDPYRCAAALADDIEMDPTPDLLVDALPDNATVCVVGWPDLIGEALLRRGDATVLAVESDDEGMGSAAFVRRLHHGDVDAEIVPASGAAAAVLSSVLVVIEAMASSSTELLATQGSRALASVAYCAEVPVWAVVGRGRCLPGPLFEAMGSRPTIGTMPWETEAELVPFALTNWVASPAGVAPTEDVSLQPECPMSYELLRSSA